MKHIRVINNANFNKYQLQKLFNTTIIAMTFRPHSLRVTVSSKEQYEQMIAKCELFKEMGWDIDLERKNYKW